MTLREAMCIATREPVTTARSADRMLTIVRRWRRESPSAFAQLARATGYPPVASVAPLAGRFAQRNSKGRIPMKTRLALVACLLVLVASSAFAQTTIATLVWDVEGAPVATVNGWTRAITVDGTAVATAPTCVAATAPTTGTTCSVPVTGLQTGTHTAIIKYTSGSQSVQNTTTGLGATGTLPTVPTNLRITVTVTVTVP